MYRINYIYTFVLFIVFSSCDCLEHKSNRVFDFRSAKVSMVSTGKAFGTIRETNATIWIDSYGERMSVLSQSVSDYSNFGYSACEEYKTLDIVRGDSIYSINLITNTGVVCSIDNCVDSLCFARLAFCAYLKHYYGVKQGVELLNGYPCKKFSLFDSQLWFYKGFPFKRVTKSLGDIFTEEVLSFEENCLVDTSKVDIPQYVRFYHKNSKCLTKNN